MVEFSGLTSCYYQVYIVMEMAGHGDLLEYIRLRGAIPDRRAATMFTDLVNGVDYLHHHNIVHRYYKFLHWLKFKHH